MRDFFKDQSQFDAQMSKEQVRKINSIVIIHFLAYSRGKIFMGNNQLLALFHERPLKYNGQIIAIFHFVPIHKIIIQRKINCFFFNINFMPFFTLQFYLHVIHQPENLEKLRKEKFPVRNNYA